jgi:hypothetical protein
MVMLRENMYLPVRAMPLSSSIKRKLDKKSRNENGAEWVVVVMVYFRSYFQIFQGV